MARSSAAVNRTIPSSLVVAGAPEGDEAGDVAAANEDEGRKPPADFPDRLFALLISNGPGLPDEMWTTQQKNSIGKVKAGLARLVLRSTTSYSWMSITPSKVRAVVPECSSP